MARKTQTIAKIETDEIFSTAATILRSLQTKLAEIERETDAVRVTDFLARHPNDKRASAFKVRLEKHRSVAGQPAVEQPATVGKLHPSVVLALDLIKGSRPVNRRINPQAVIEQLDEDAGVIREAITIQQAAVDTIRDEASTALATRLLATHRELVLSQFRAAQAFAAATDAEAAFRRAVTDAGYIWNPALMPAPTMRAALVLGSEDHFDSDIGRTRRLLEELKLL